MLAQFNDLKAECSIQTILKGQQHPQANFGIDSIISDFRKMDVDPELQENPQGETCKQIIACPKLALNVVTDSLEGNMHLETFVKSKEEKEANDGSFDRKTNQIFKRWLKNLQNYSSMKSLKDKQSGEFDLDYEGQD